MPDPAKQSQPSHHDEPDLRAEVVKLWAAIGDEPSEVHRRPGTGLTGIVVSLAGEVRSLLSAIESERAERLARAEAWRRRLAIGGGILSSLGVVGGGIAWLVSHLHLK